MVRVLRSQTDARTVVEPEPSTPRLFLGDLQPLPSPDPLDALEVHHLAGMPQQRGDPAIAVAARAGGERDDLGGQRRLVVR